MAIEPNSVKWTDICIVILTVGIVVAAMMQWGEMHDAGTQTDKMISAAQKIESDLEAANAQNLEALRKTLSQSQAATNASNSQSQKVLDATIEQARLDQRAWLTVEVGEKTGNFAVGIRNTGKTPAVNVTEVTAFSASSSGNPPDVDLARNSSSPFPVPRNAPPEFMEALRKEGLIRSHPPTGYVIAPGDTQIASDYQGKFAQIFGFDRKNPMNRPYIQGKVTYDDIFGQHHQTTYCYWFAPPSDFVMCNDHNKMN